MSRGRNLEVQFTAEVPTWGDTAKVKPPKVDVEGMKQVFASTIPAFQRNLYDALFRSNPILKFTVRNR